MRSSITSQLRLRAITPPSAGGARDEPGLEDEVEGKIVHGAPEPPVGDGFRGQRDGQRNGVNEALLPLLATLPRDDARNRPGACHRHVLRALVAGNPDARRTLLGAALAPELHDGAPGRDRVDPARTQGAEEALVLEQAGRPGLAAAGVELLPGPTLPGRQPRRGRLGS